MNAIKDSIKSGRTVVGTAGAPNVDVSILADAGYDFLLFDTQHSPWEIKQLQPSDLTPSSQAEPSSGRPGHRTLTCRFSQTPGTTSCFSTPSTPPGRSNSCSRPI